MSGSRLPPAVLVEKAREIVGTYNENTCTIDVHIENFLGKQEKYAGTHSDFRKTTQHIEDPYDRDFLSQVCYGVYRYEKILRDFLNALYFLHSSSVLRSDFGLFQVFAFLALLKLDEMGSDPFITFIDSQDPVKMHTFLGFLLDEVAIHEYVVEEWVKHLDRSYVNSTLLDRIERHRNALSYWMDRNRERAFGVTNVSESQKTRKQRREPTKPMAPKLSAPKNKPLKVSVFVPQPFVAKEFPEWIENTSLEEIEAQNRDRRRKIADETINKYDPDLVPQFPRSKNRSDFVRRQLELEEAEYLARTRTQRKQVPDFLPAATIRLNKAAVLREDAIYRQKQMEDAAVLKEYEASRHDKAEWSRLKKAAEDKDRLAEEERVKHRRIQAQRTAKMAVKVMEDIRLGNMVVRQKMKEQSEIAKTIVALREDEDRESRRQIADTVKQREFLNPNRARTAITIAKRKQARELSAQRRVTEAIRADDQVHELDEKRERVRKLKALERVPQLQPRLFDPTEEVGDPETGRGFLNGMSLLEMRERYNLLQDREVEEVENKRATILNNRAKQAYVLQGVAERIAARRSIASSVGERRRSEKVEKKYKEAEDLALSRIAPLLAVEERLVTRQNIIQREKEVRAEAEVDTVSTMRQLGALSAGIEESRMKDLLRASHVRAEKLQAMELQLEADRERVRLADRNSKIVREEELQQSQREQEKQRTLAFQESRKEEIELRLEETARKKAIFLKTTEEEAALRDRRDAMNEYAASMRYASRAKARHMRNAPPLDEEHAKTLLLRKSRLPENHPLGMSMGMKLQGWNDTLQGIQGSMQQLRM